MSSGACSNRGDVSGCLGHLAGGCPHVFAIKVKLKGKTDTGAHDDHWTISGVIRWGDSADLCLLGCQ
jgi:hypothetical protein